MSVWETESARRLFTVRHDQRIVNLRFSPDSRWLVVASADRRVTIWDARTGEAKGTLAERADYWQFAISPDSTRFVTASGHFRIWKLPGGEPMTPPLAASGPISFASWIGFSPDGTLFTVSHGSRVQVYDADTGAAVGPILTHSGQAVLGRISNDNRRVGTNSSDGSIRIWELPSGKLLRAVQFGGDVAWGDFTPDGRLYVARSGDGMVHVIDVETGRPALEPIRAGGIRGARMRRDGAEIMTAGRDGAVRRWRLTPGAIKPMEIVPDATLRSLQRTVTDRPVAWAIRADRIQPIDLLTGRPDGEAQLFPVPILGGVVSPNGQFLAVRTEAGATELWTSRGGDHPAHVAIGTDDGTIAGSVQPGLGLPRHHGLAWSPRHRYANG